MTWLGITLEHDEFARSPSYDDDYLSDDSDSRHMLQEDPASHDSTFGPFQPWMPKVGFRRRSSSESYDGEEEDDRNSLSDTEFMLIRRLSCLVSPSRRKPALLQRRHHELVASLRRNVHSEQELTAYDRSNWPPQHIRIREIARVSECIEEDNPPQANGYMSSSSDEEPVRGRRLRPVPSSLAITDSFNNIRKQTPSPLVRDDPSDRAKLDSRQQESCSESSVTECPFSADSPSQPRLSVRSLCEIFERTSRKTEGSNPSVMRKSVSLQIAQDFPQPSMCPLYAFQSHDSRNLQTSQKPLLNNFKDSTQSGETVNLLTNSTPAAQTSKCLADTSPQVVNPTDLHKSTPLTADCKACIDNKICVENVCDSNSNCDVTNK